MVAKVYNRLAGGALERIAALSDGVFAIALTLIVLEIRPPAHASVHSDADLLAGLAALAPRFVMFLMGFMTLGIFWVGQQTQLSHLARSDRHFTWIHIVFLAGVSLVPFSTSVLAEFYTLKVALGFYWLNILLLGALLFASWRYALHAQLLKPEAEAGVSAAIERRILVAQALYAIAAAAAFLDTRIAIGLIVLLQLNYAVAPRWGILGRV